MSQRKFVDRAVGMIRTFRKGVRGSPVDMATDFLRIVERADTELAMLEALWEQGNGTSFGKKDNQLKHQRCLIFAKLSEAIDAAHVDTGDGGGRNRKCARSRKGRPRKYKC